MTVYYQIPALGKVGSHYLAMGVLGTMFGGIALLSGGSSKAAQQSPPIKASSRGEEDFIQYVPNNIPAQNPQKAFETFRSARAMENALTDRVTRKFLQDAEKDAKREGKH